MAHRTIEAWLSDMDGRVVAAQTPGIAEPSVQVPEVERADEPKGGDSGGQIVPGESPGTDEQPAPASDEQRR